MVQGYYSLDEAAQILGMSTEQLSQMAQKREVRAFADRGTWRFRTQDVEELARQRGRGSEPDLQFHDLPPRRGDTPKPKKQAPLVANDAPISLVGDDEQVEIGRETTRTGAGGSGKLKGKESDKNLGGAKSPTPKPGSDSDVRLVPEGSGLSFQIAGDNDLRLEEASPKTPKPSRVVPEHKSDSSVRIVPMESDRDVKIIGDRSEDSAVRLADDSPKAGTDSDIRLELAGGSKSGSKSGGKAAPKLPPASKAGDDSVLTEEIDLDAEERKWQEQQASKTRKKTQTTPQGSSESGKTPKPGPAKKASDSSSDFELTPMGAGDQPTREEEVDLGIGPAGGRPGADSGIRLHDPKDSGISLEQTAEGSSDLEFELTPEKGSTPKPGKKAKAKPPKEEDSDSEFELTLDDSGLKPLDSDARGPADSDKDIFETDFEVPALEDDSGSEAVALEGSDTDLESSDFELAIGDDDMVAEDESGSQVVALDDEADEGAATIARKRRGGRARGLAGAEEGEEEFAEMEDEDRPLRTTVPAAAEQSWGMMVPIVAFLTLLVIFLGGLMSYELVHGMWGYKQTQKVGALVVDPLSEAILGKDALPKDR